MATPQKLSVLNNKMPLLEQRTLVDRNRRKSRKLRTGKNAWFTGTIAFRGLVQISDDLKPVTGRFQMDNRKDQVQAEIIDNIDRYFGFENYEALWLYFDIDYFEAGTIPTSDIKTRKMRESKPLNLSVNIFNNIIEIDTSNNNCVVDTLNFLYPKIANLKKGNPILELKEANTNEVMSFCKKFGIRAIAYDWEKNVIAENIPEKDCGKYKTLAYLYYNNHMYLLKNKYLIEKPEATAIQQETQENLDAHFRSLINQGEVPTKIKIQGYSVTSFQHNNTIYFNNPDYEKCINITKTFMFSDKVPHYASLSSIMKFIEPLYTSTFATSFLPIKHVKPAFYYNKQLDKSRETQTIDKNKAYSYVLKNLPYLLSTDFRTYECFKTNKFVDEFCLYVAKPNFPNILMAKQDIYSGQHIRFCVGKFEFEILEVLRCKKTQNYYAQIIDDIYKKFPETLAKDIVNRAIGMFQKESSANNEDVILIGKEDRNPKRSSFEIDSDLYVEFVPNNSVSNLYNKKPIAIQIKDMTNQILYEKMEELNLSDEDIVQINTDSLTFYSKPNLNLKLSKHFDGWKQGTHNDRITTSIFDNSVPFDTFFQTIPNNNEIILGYAGNGKSYHIKNNLDLTDSIILSSKHSAIRQHRENKLNAQVIQKYCAFTKNQKTTFPSERHIIVEECGILTREHWDFLHKCILLNKKLTLLGDFNQLLPVDEIHTFNRPQYLNMVFSKQTPKLENWRNNFSIAYYDQLINSTDKEFLLKEIQKYSTKTPEEADVIIAYRNTIVEKYNNYMLNHYNKQITDPNVPVMCITNELRNKDMFNNFLFKSQEIDTDLLTNEKYFRPAYARTLYNMQGDECISYYIAPEDSHWFANPRMAYTLISRLKSRHLQ